MPNGVSVENDEYGNPKFTLSNRAADHFVTARQIGNRTYRLIAVSLNNSQFNGTDGLLFNCPLEINGLTGIQEISLNNMIVVRPDNTEINCPNFIGQISVAQSSIDDISIKAGNHSGYYNERKRTFSFPVSSALLQSSASNSFPPSYEGDAA